MIRLGFARRIQLSAGHGLKHWVLNQTVHEYDESRMTACVKLCDLGCFFLCLPHLVGVLKRLVSTQLLDCGCTNLTKSLHPNYGIHLNVFLNFTHKKKTKKKTPKPKHVAYYVTHTVATLNHLTSKCFTADTIQNKERLKERILSCKITAQKTFRELNLAIKNQMPYHHHQHVIIRVVVI